MLATLVDKPLQRPGWIYEEKYDGYRVLAYKEGAKVKLLSRNGNDRTESFAEIAAAVARVPADTLLLDGEAVAFDKRLVSRFQLLQASELPRIYAVFDCLFVNGLDLRGEPLPVRRQALEQLIDGIDHLLPARRLGDDGLAAYKVAARKGFEGLIAKDPAAPYVEGRSTRWLKVKVHQEEELVIGGYTAPAGTRAHFGALLLGAYRGRELRYVGKVGTGFSMRVLDSLARTFATLRRSTSPFAEPIAERKVVWLEPQLVAQVAFSEWTNDQKLRQPVFLGLRDDKRPSECRLPARRA
ncbi:MAG TPA: non-homologous end-joining DNA ligase [Candidatus Bathyarchaeia archaeon]|nr:non-homologous end-joining DNA ligase [Candidatus Bathyarchaeia archaeon]